MAIIFIVLFIIAAGLALYFASNPRTSTVTQILTSSYSPVSQNSAHASSSSSISSTTSSASGVLLETISLQSGNTSYLVFTLNNTKSTPTDITGIVFDNAPVKSIAGTSQTRARMTIPTTDNCVHGDKVNTFSVLINATVNLNVNYTYTIGLANGQTF